MYLRFPLTLVAPIRVAKTDNARHVQRLSALLGKIKKQFLTVSALSTSNASSYLFRAYATQSQLGLALLSAGFGFLDAAEDPSGTGTGI
jgi:hypothetical protein